MLRHTACRLSSKWWVVIRKPSHSQIFSLHIKRQPIITTTTTTINYDSVVNKWLYEMSRWFAHIESGIKIRIIFIFILWQECEKVFTFFSVAFFSRLIFEWLNSHWIIFINILIIWIQSHTHTQCAVTNVRENEMRRSYWDLCKYWRTFGCHLLDLMNGNYISRVLTSSSCSSFEKESKMFASQKITDTPNTEQIEKRKRLICNFDVVASRSAIEHGKAFRARGSLVVSVISLIGPRFSASVSIPTLSSARFIQY